MLPRHLPYSLHDLLHIRHILRLHRHVPLLPRPASGAVARPGRPRFQRLRFAKFYALLPPPNKSPAAPSPYPDAIRFPSSLLLSFREIRFFRASLLITFLPISTARS